MAYCKATFKSLTRLFYLLKKTDFDAYTTYCNVDRSLEFYERFVLMNYLRFLGNREVVSLRGIKIMILMRGRNISVGLHWIFKYREANTFCKELNTFGCKSISDLAVLVAENKFKLINLNCAINL